MKLFICESKREYIAPDAKHETIKRFQQQTGETVDRIWPAALASAKVRIWKDAAKEDLF
jgi:hypothetical protein